MSLEREAEIDSKAATALAAQGVKCIPKATENQEQTK
jgi:hypothetical protein